MTNNDQAVKEYISAHYSTKDTIWDRCNDYETTITISQELLSLMLMALHNHISTISDKPTKKKRLEVRMIQAALNLGSMMNDPGVVECISAQEMGYHEDMAMMALKEQTELSVFDPGAGDKKSVKILREFLVGIQRFRYQGGRI